MIGPGTGVAPFRAFLQQRQAAGATGRNWLFFGDRNFTHDFLYQLEWQEWLKDGLLTRLDVAFSRDQPEKTYVQHRMWQRRAELFAWLEDGAHLYVCGDEKAMAKDVHATLAAIVADQSGRPPDAAEAYLADLKKQRRYQRDVY
jgi:sulfite reductase (NADPH) flavoprotein alpha-component